MVDAIATVATSKTEQVVQQLLDWILDAQLAPGSSFGTEAELVQRFGISRPTLREGLRILQSQGVLRTRPGPGGGIMVAKPSVAILAHSLSVFLQLHGVSFTTVLETREVLEPALAAQAAINGTNEHFKALQASVDRMKAQGLDSFAFLDENITFHSLIAKASGNEVMAIFWQTISALAAGEHQGIEYSARNIKHVIEAHQRIVDACRERDSIAASEQMRGHLTELEVLVRKRNQRAETQRRVALTKAGGYNRRR